MIRKLPLLVLFVLTFISAFSYNFPIKHSVTNSSNKLGIVMSKGNGSDNANKNAEKKKLKNQKREAKALEKQKKKKIKEEWKALKKVQKEVAAKNRPALPRTFY